MQKIFIGQADIDDAYIVKRWRHVPLQTAGHARCRRVRREHDNEAIPRLDVYGLYPNRSKLRSITFKINSESVYKDILLIPFTEWSLNKLQDHIISTKDIDSISIETIRRILKENGVKCHMSSVKDFMILY